METYNPADGLAELFPTPSVEVRLIRWVELQNPRYNSMPTAAAEVRGDQRSGRIRRGFSLTRSKAVVRTKSLRLSFHSR
jgi:hypothetical protein